MNKSYKFGGFYLDTSSRNLLHQEKLIRLSPRAFDILLYLLENQGKVVKKDDLLEIVWKDSFVEENNLPVHISALRRVLRERDSNTKHIETISGRGYCFLTPVQKIDSDIFSTLSTSLPPDANKISSIAILPFSNKSNDSKFDYLAEGIAESLISNLSQLPQLKVMAYSAVSRYKEKVIDVQEIAFILGVSKILSGKIVKLGENLEVSLELINVSDLTQLWGEQYEFQPEDLFKLKKEISHKIVESLKLELTKTEATKLNKQYTSSSTAYKLYLQGRKLMDDRTKPNLLKSIECFEKALKIDSKFALAYTGIADAYNFLGNYFFLSSIEVLPKIKSAIQMSLSLDENLSEAYSSLGFLHLFYEYNVEKVESSLKTALKLNPNNVFAHTLFSVYFLNFSNAEKSLFHHYKALELDPLSITLNGGLASRFIFLNDYSSAIIQGEELLSLYPDYSYGYYYLAFAYAQMGDFVQAVKNIDKALRLNNSLEILALKGYILAFAGSKKEAKQVLDEIIKTSLTTPIDFIDIAHIYAALNEKDKAFEYLEKAREARMNHFCILKVDPRFDKLRSDPRFNPLLQRIGLV